MIGIARRRQKIEGYVEGFCIVVLRVDDERPDSGDASGLQRARVRIFQKTGANAFALPTGGNSQARQQHDRDWMPGQSLRQAFRRIVVFNLAQHERVVADHLRIAEGNICLRGFGLLVLKGVANEETVERLAVAVEGVDCVAALELFDAEGMRQPSRPRSNTLGSWRSLSRRGEGCGEASRAF